MDDVTRVQTDVQLQLALDAQLDAAPDGDDRLRRRREDGHDAITQHLPIDRRTARLPHRRSHPFVESARSISERGIAKALSERGGVRDVREEDDRRSSGRIVKATVMQPDEPFDRLHDRLMPPEASPAPTAGSRITTAPASGPRFRAERDASYPLLPHRLMSSARSALLIRTSPFRSHGLFGPTARVAK